MARLKQATPRRIDPVTGIRDPLPPSTGSASTGKAKGKKAKAPVKRDVEETPTKRPADEKPKKRIVKQALIPRRIPPPPKEPGMTELLFCIGGIYASFLTWGVLQERITKTTHGPDEEVFQYPVFLNTIQSAFAAFVGFLYLLASSRSAAKRPSIFPTSTIIAPLFLVAVTTSLASPFGYASLKHIDYLTFVLAKSCKLLPVMALHITVFQKRYALYKYAVVALVTAGVAMFTLYHPTAGTKSKGPAQSSVWGLTLLGINLLLDGLTNSTQDHIFTHFQPFSGPQMMCAQNLLNTALTIAYMVAQPVLVPYLPASLELGAASGGSGGDGGEFGVALGFLQRHPSVARDVVGFALCGAVGQVFIFTTLAHFSSLLLVTVTVTRKMLTMILSVVWFGHRLAAMQWAAVGLVFTGIAAEAWITKREKEGKEKKSREAEKGGKAL